METNFLKLARKAMGFFPLATPAQRARQAAKYANARIWLGNKWILAKDSSHV